MRDVFTTARLRMSEFTEDDAPFILNLLNTEGWLNYIGDRGVRSLEDARHYLRSRIISHYIAHGFGMWKVATLAHNEAIGMAGILKRESLQVPDAGFAMLPEFTGMGYASEALAGCLEYARQHTKITELWAIVQENNAASARTLERAGFAHIEPVEVEGERLLRYARRLRPSV